MKVLRSTIAEQTIDQDKALKVFSVSPPERCDFTSSQQYNNNVL